MVGEYVYAQHSIIYDDLETYFYCFSIWDDNNICLSYADTLEWCTLLDIVHVPILYVGKFDYNKIEKIFTGLDFTKQEGIVVRNANAFHYDTHKDNLFKAVRPAHVQTDEHWMNAPLVPNKLKNG